MEQSAPSAALPMRRVNCVPVDEVERTQAVPARVSVSEPMEPASVRLVDGDEGGERGRESDGAVVEDGGGGVRGGGLVAGFEDERGGRGDVAGAVLVDNRAGGGVDERVEGLLDAEELRAVQAQAQGVGVAGGEGERGAGFDAEDHGGGDGVAGALADVEAGEAIRLLRGPVVEAADDAGGAGGEGNGVELEDEGAADFDRIPGGEGGLAVEAVAAGDGEAGGGEGDVGAGVVELPLLQVEGGLGERLGEEGGVGCVRGCRLAEQVEDGGGAVAGEELGPVGGGFECAGDGDIVGELFERGGFERGDFEGAVAVRQGVLGDGKAGESDGAVDGAVARVGGAGDEAGVLRPDASLLRLEDAGDARGRAGGCEAGDRQPLDERGDEVRGGGADAGSDSGAPGLLVEEPFVGDCGEREAIDGAGGGLAGVERGGFGGEVAGEEGCAGVAGDDDAATARGRGQDGGGEAEQALEDGGCVEGAGDLERLGGVDGGGVVERAEAVEVVDG